MVILTIGAHPADVFDLAGGTLANFSGLGHDVYLAVITHGAYSHAQVITAKNQRHALEEVMSVKRKECDEAARHIGLRACAISILMMSHSSQPGIPCWY